MEQYMETTRPFRNTIVARIDRLPPSRYLLKLVARVAAGGWFEFYELFMPGFISLGLVNAGIYQLHPGSLFDPCGCGHSRLEHCQHAIPPGA